MKNLLIAAGIALVGVQAFADTTYYCNKGYLTVTLSSDKKDLTVQASEWGGDYRVSKTSSAEFDVIHDSSFDSDLGATQAYVSQSLLEGAKKASITLKGGEDGGRYDDCALN